MSVRSHGNKGVINRQIEIALQKLGFKHGGKDHFKLELSPEVNLFLYPDLKKKYGCYESDPMVGLESEVLRQSYKNSPEKNETSTVCFTLMSSIDEVREMWGSSILRFQPQTDNFNSLEALTTAVGEVLIPYMRKFGSTQKLIEMLRQYIDSLSNVKYFVIPGAPEKLRRLSTN